MLLAVLAWGAGAAFHPGTAKSFVGESLVEAAGGGLTKAAEKVVQAGKFVPELVARGATQGGAAEASEVASTFEAAGALPVLSSFAAFGVGTKVGSEICGAIGIEGCWYGASETADPPVGGKGHYVFLANSPITGPNGVPHYMYWYNESGYVALWKGWGGEPKGAEGCGIEPPTSVQAFAPSASSVDCKGRSVESGALYRYAMANRTLEYHATDDPAIPNATPQWCPQGSACVFTQPSGWAANLANVLSSSAGAETATREKVGQAIAHAIDPTAVAEPFAIEGTVPNCGGLTYAQCEAALELEGLEAVKNTLGWQTADLSRGAARVTATSPAAGKVVATHTKVTVTVNPAEMPLLVPEPEQHETYSHYAERVPVGLVPHRTTVGEAEEQVGAGPDAVLGVSPEPGSRADPSTDTDIDVRTNPHTAPPVGAGGGTCGATVGAIDWSPLNIPLGSKFPFGVFGFFAGWIGEWEAGSSTAPNWELTLVPAGIFGNGALKVPVDLDKMAPVINVVRTVFLFASFVGLLWFLGTAAAKLQGDHS